MDVYAVGAKNYDKINDERQKAFLKFVLDNQPTNVFADKFSKLVEESKRNTQWRKQFMDWKLKKHNFGPNSPFSFIFSCNSL